MDPGTIKHEHILVGTQTDQEPEHDYEQDDDHLGAERGDG